MTDVQTVQLDTEWVKRLHAMLDMLRRVVCSPARCLVCRIVLIVGNTIRLDILNRRAEIEVMKLVGATDGFARRPFLYSGIWYGSEAALVAVDAGGRRRGGAGAAASSSSPCCTAAISLGGLEIRLDRLASWASSIGPGLDGLLACCDAAYPGDRAAKYMFRHSFLVHRTSARLLAL